MLFRSHQPDREESEREQQYLRRGRGETQKGERGNLPYVKSIPLRTTVNRSLAYILNPDKTENLLYTNAVNCLPNAKDAYLAMKWVYEHFSGEKYNAPLPKQGKGSVKAIHYIQSFDPKDNISPELAHQIARTFARKAFGDNCQVVIATHVDKQHIHSHIIINAYGIGGRKFNDNQATLGEGGARER